MKILFQIAVLLFLWSCSDSGTNNSNLIEFSVIDFDTKHADQNYEFIIIDFVSETDNGFIEYGYQNLIDKIPQRKTSYIDEFLKKTALKPKFEIDFLNKEKRILMLIKNNIVYDIIELNKKNRSIILKDINTYSISNELVSNAYNIIDQTNVVFSNKTLLNSSLIFLTNQTALFDNVIFDSCLINPNLANTSITLNNTTIKNSELININKPIFTANTVKLTKTSVFNGFGNDFIFQSTNSTLIIDSSIFESINKLFLTVSGEMTLNYCYFDLVNETIKNTESSVDIRNSFFSNIQQLELGLRGSLYFGSSIATKFLKLFDTFGQDLVIENSHIEETNIEHFLRLDNPNQILPVDTIYIENSNLIVDSEQSTVFIFIYFNLKTEIKFNNSYVDLNVVNPHSRIFDRNDDSSFTSGAAHFFNSKTTQIKSIGIQ